MPVVAGQFYPGARDTLIRAVRSYTSYSGAKSNALGCIVPHAGYMYSGQVAGAVYGRIELPRRFIILCPNHTGQGAPLSIMTDTVWRTPLGEVRVDTSLAEALLQQMPQLSEDLDAQQHEHALEVQLPFLQELLDNFTFVPITIGTSRLEHLVALVKAMGAVLANVDEQV